MGEPGTGAAGGFIPATDEATEETAQAARQTQAPSPSANGHAGLPASYDADRELVSDRMRRFVDSVQNGVYALCSYHLGWTDTHGRPSQAAAGKMLRPVLCLAACRGYGAAERAAGIAAAIELLHAFSLVHDDIEDEDRERRGRPTLWTLVGVPLALNAGDSLFALANRALIDTAGELPAELRFAALQLFSDACLRIIEGQHLDIEFETRDRLTTAEYVQMAQGKTGALIGASLALGALCGGASEADVERLRVAGVELGLAFQAVDDALAIWGDPALTGKAVGNDLARGKKSLPVTIAMERGWAPSTADGLSLPELRGGLEALGVHDAVQRFAVERAAAAQRLLDTTAISPAGRRELSGISGFILARQS